MLRKFFCVSQTEAIARFPFNHFYNENEATSPSLNSAPVAAQTIPWPGQAGTSCVFCHVQGDETRLEEKVGVTAMSGYESLINKLEIQAVVC